MCNSVCYAAIMFDRLSALPGYLLRRASAASLADLNGRLAELSINHADASLLLLIGDNPGVTQSEVGKVLGIQRANMVPLIARNEARGWLQREQVDGRSQGLSLSPGGRDAAGKVSAIVEGYEKELIARVPEDLRPHVVPVLRYLRAERQDQPSGRHLPPTGNGRR